MPKGRAGAEGSISTEGLARLYRSAGAVDAAVDLVGSDIVGSQSPDDVRRVVYDVVEKVSGYPKYLLDMDFDLKEQLNLDQEKIDRVDNDLVTRLGLVEGGVVEGQLKGLTSLRQITETLNEAIGGAADAKA